MIWERVKNHLIMLRSKGKEIPIFFTEDKLKDLDLESGHYQPEKKNENRKTIDYNTLFQSQIKLTKRGSLNTSEKVFQPNLLPLKRVKEAEEGIMTLDYNKILFGNQVETKKGSNTQETDYTQGTGGGGRVEGSQISDLTLGKQKLDSDFLTQQLQTKREVDFHFLFINNFVNQR